MIIRRIAVLQQSGGYLLITAPTGAGKSSTIAKLIEQDGIDTTAAFFIDHRTTVPLFELSLLIEEPKHTNSVDIPTLLRRAGHHPKQIIGLVIERLADAPRWDSAIRPVLGFLLATIGTQPISADAYATLMGLADDALSQVLHSMHEFIAESDQGGRPVYYFRHQKN